ncbi:hypothetical protein EG329_003672 [Mollisiaceae sp. DMI_Dod_QoI]|nr:hypothetical protein EG329_003672 [Helotiales sp. DMI_Dod_QoI]
MMGLRTLGRGNASACLHRPPLEKLYVQQFGFLDFANFNEPKSPPTAFNRQSDYLTTFLWRFRYAEFEHRDGALIRLSQLCGHQILGVSFHEGGLAEARPYISITADINSLKNSEAVREHLRSTSGLEEGSPFSQRVCMATGDAEACNRRTARHKVTPCTPIESKLDHIPMTVVAWCQTETRGGRASSIEVTGYADATIIPSDHPRVFDSPALSSSSSSTSSSFTCSDVIRRLWTHQKTSARPHYSCLTSSTQQPIPGDIPSNVAPWILFRFIQIRTCLLIWSFVAAVVILSVFLGLFFTLDKSYGYSMSDAFTLSAFVIAIGALITSVLGRCHYPHCTCWGRPRERAGLE